MNVVPPTIVLDDTISCPSCAVQKSNYDNDIGWVSCPIIDNQALCLGCCLDLQTIARNKDFGNDPYVDDFVQFVKKHNEDLVQMRLICLEHQEEIAVSEINIGRNDESKYREFLEQIRALISSLKIH